MINEAAELNGYYPSDEAVFRKYFPDVDNSAPEPLQILETALDSAQKALDNAQTAMVGFAAREILKGDFK